MSEPTIHKPQYSYGTATEPTLVMISEREHERLSKLDAENPRLVSENATLKKENELLRERLKPLVVGMHTIAMSIPEPDKVKDWRALCESQMRIADEAIEKLHAVGKDDPVAPAG